MPEHICPKCGGEMERGFVVDKKYGGGYASSEWAGGDPEPSFWTGVKMGDRDRHPVVTYRCARCGFLESYAKLE